MSPVARGDLLIHLGRAAREHDDGELRRAVKSMIADEREKQHHLLTERLEAALRTVGSVETSGRHESRDDGLRDPSPLAGDLTIWFCETLSTRHRGAVKSSSARTSCARTASSRDIASC